MPLLQCAVLGCQESQDQGYILGLHTSGSCLEWRGISCIFLGVRADHRLAGCDCEGALPVPAPASRSCFVVVQVRADEGDIEICGLVVALLSGNVQPRMVAVRSPVQSNTEAFRHVPKLSVGDPGFGAERAMRVDQAEVGVAQVFDTVASALAGKMPLGLRALWAYESAFNHRSGLW